MTLEYFIGCVIFLCITSIFVPEVPWKVLNVQKYSSFVINIYQLMPSGACMRPLIVSSVVQVMAWHLFDY